MGIITGSARFIVPKATRRILRLVEHNIRMAYFLFAPKAKVINIIEAIRYGISGRGFLDYPKAQILMEVSAYRQIDHLKSCKREPETVAWLESFLRPDEVLYDVGASVGAYSFVAWAVAGGRCKVFSFEPSFSTFAALCKNILLNNSAEEIYPFQVALAGTTMLTTFSYSDVLPGGVHHVLGDDPRGPQSGANGPSLRQTILAYRLDDFVRKFHIPPPNHIKIDVDGGELGVIKGAVDTLRNPILRSVLVEIDESLPDAKMVVAEIQKAGLALAQRHKRKRFNTFNYIFERLK